jgi:CDGSH-type Zn-finger protein
MTKAKVAAKNPVVLELGPGTYYWCACGQSNKQPFCDGSHKGSEFRSKPFELKQKVSVAICQCKQTKNPPFCDGSHSAAE